MSKVRREVSEESTRLWIGISAELPWGLGEMPLATHKEGGRHSGHQPLQPAASLPGCAPTFLAGVGALELWGSGGLWDLLRLRSSRVSRSSGAPTPPCSRGGRGDHPGSLTGFPQSRELRQVRRHLPGGRAKYSRFP